MNRSQQMLVAFGEAVAEGSRWPRLIKMLGLEGVNGWPGARAINDALQVREFRPVVDETLVLHKMLSDYPESWWFAIARETAGREDASVQAVIDALGDRSAQHAAQ